MPEPNLIVIMADQLRFDALGAHTPHLNALLGESTVFERAYCNSPLCVPARGAFFSGRYPNETGCLINPWVPQDRQHGYVKPGTPNLYSMLEQRWDSWHTGKQHFYTADGIDKKPDSRTHWRSLEAGYGPMLKERGIRSPGGPAYQGLMPELTQGRVTRAARYSIPTVGCYPHGLENFFDGYILKTSLDAIRERDRSRPFALNAMFLAPHPPLEIPEPWFSQIKDAPLPENVGRWSKGQSPLQLYNLTGALGARYERADWEKIWPVYLGLVALLDHCVGEILNLLKAEGLYDDALILFTADHGEMLGSHGLWQKMCMYEESAHVPLAFRLPAALKTAAQPKRSAELVSHIDVLPTLCDLLSLPKPEGLPGRSLARCLREGAPLPPAPAFIQFDGNGGRGNFQRSVVDGAHKLIVDLFQGEVFFELYDVVRDPQELRNLAWEDPARVRALAERLRAHMHATGDLLSFELSDYDRFAVDYADNKPN
ncbi:MAG: sulfatase-like hydrolase/transferase [Planctomycetota bacterium]|nr:sulfatase-like hydrolase/transferase [Planctomycetota bacterium]